MRLTFRLSCVIALLIILAHRALAPIQEIPESAAPSATATPAPRPKSANKSVRIESNKTTQTKKTALSSFAGKWRGTLTGAASDGGSAQNDFMIIIAQDGQVAWTKWRSANGNWPPETIAGSCQSSGNVISWSFMAGRLDDPTKIQHSFTLRLNGARIATATHHVVITSGQLAGGTVDQTGTLTKE